MAAHVVGHWCLARLSTARAISEAATITSIHSVRSCGCSRRWLSSGKGRKPDAAESEETALDTSPKTVFSREVCTGANYFNTGEDPPLKDDKEYPEWLWELTTTKIATKDLPTDSPEQLRRKRKELIRNNNKISKMGF